MEDITAGESILTTYVLLVYPIPTELITKYKFCAPSIIRIHRQ